jgi:histidinol dehydrogenase
MKRFTLPNDKERLFKRIQLSSENDLELINTVSPILLDIQKNGDKALVDYTAKFDGVDISTEEIAVSQEELDKGAEKANKDIQAAVKTAIQNITDFHKNQKPENFSFTGKYGETLGQTYSPISTAGVYIPGGNAGVTPLISSAMMNIIPAQLAGCKKIIAMSPPNTKHTLHPALLYTLKALHITEIYKGGGAQAIGAMTYGTQTIPKVDIVVGPGGKYGTTAKRLVFGKVMIDGIFGPSEIVAISDGSGNPSFIAADLLSQSEHAGDELSVLITTDTDFADKVEQELHKQISFCSRSDIIKNSLDKRGCIIIVPDIKTALEVSNAIAPEHLELALSNPETYVPMVENAGAVFVGEHAPEPIGDYICGTNHVLPTAGTARFFSPLGVYTFMKCSNVIRYNESAFNAYAKHAVAIGKAEGLDAHCRSITIRNDI